MEHLIRASASIIAIWLIGYASVLFMFRAKPIRGAALSFALGLGLGFGLLAEICMVSLALTKRIDFKFVYAALVVAMIAIVYEKRRFEFSRLFACINLRKIMQKTGASERPAPEKIIMGVGKSFVAIVALVVAFNLLARPMYQFDARAIWGLKAKVLFQERTIFSESVENISRNHPHPRYPLLIPLSSAWIFYNIGEADDRVVRLVFLVFFIGLIAAAFRLQQEHTGDVAAFLSLSAFLFVPYIYGSKSGGASSGHADITLSFYITASALAIMLWMKQRNAVFVIVGALFAACAALTKNEGLVYAMILFLTAAVFTIASKEDRKADRSKKSLADEWFKVRQWKLFGLAAYVLVGIVALIPWLLVRADLPKFLDEDYLRYLNVRDIVAGAARLPTIMKIFCAELLNTKNWGLIWVLIAASACAAWWKGNKESRFVSVVMALQIAAYLVVFVITPYDVAGQMIVSVPRLLLHVLPLGVTLVSFQVADTIQILIAGKQSEISG